MLSNEAVETALTLLLLCTGLKAGVNGYTAVVAHRPEGGCNDQQALE